MYFGSKYQSSLLIWNQYYPWKYWSIFMWPTLTTRFFEKWFWAREENVCLQFSYFQATWCRLETVHAFAGQVFLRLTPRILLTFCIGNGICCSTFPQNLSIHHILMSLCDYIIQAPETRPCKLTQKFAELWIHELWLLCLWRSCIFGLLACCLFWLSRQRSISWCPTCLYGNNKKKNKMLV